MGLGLKIPCLLRVVMPVGVEGGCELIGLREAGPIEKGEEGVGWWTRLREAGPVEGGKEGEDWLAAEPDGAGLIGVGPVGEEEGRGDWGRTGLREAGPVGEGEDGE